MAANFHNRHREFYETEQEKAFAATVARRKRELESCGAVQAFLLLLLTLSSCCEPFSVSFSDGWSVSALSFLFGWIDGFGFEAFALVSGYVFYYLKFEKDGGLAKNARFLDDKAKRLLGPYVAVAACWSAPICWLLWGPDELAARYLWGCEPGRLELLLALFWLFVGFWRAADFIDRRPLEGAALVFLCFVVGRVSVPWGLGRALECAPYFYVGFMIRRGDWTGKFLTKIPSWSYWTIYTALFIVWRNSSAFKEYFQQYEYFNKYFFEAGAIGVRFFMALVGATASFVVLRRVVERLKENGVWRFWAKRGFTIFLFHQPFVYLVYFGLEGRVPPLFVAALSVILSLTGSVFLAELASKTKWARFLLETF